MALLFMESFDKYGSPNTNGTAVQTLLTAGEWNSAAAVAQIVAPLSATGQALAVGGAGTVTKTLATLGRVIGGLRFSSSSLSSVVGIQFLDTAANQCGIVINTNGTIQLRNGSYTAGTSIAISSTSITAGSVHYLEWDITLGNSAAYQVWLDGVSLFSGTGDTTATANNTINGFSLIQPGASVFTVDDLYIFDAAGTVNNAPLLTSPRIETQFPSGDASVQFALGAAILGSSVLRATTNFSPTTNMLYLRPFTPVIACTLTAISIYGNTTNAGVNIKPAVYTDSAGVPGLLLTVGSPVTGVTSGTAKTYPLTTPQSLTAGTQYWLGYLIDTGVTNLLLLGDAGNSGRSVTSSYASPPSSAPAMSAGIGTVHLWGNVTITGNNWYVASGAGQSVSQGSQSYLYDAAVGHEDLFSFSALSSTPSAIYAVAVKASVAKSDAGAKTVSMRIKSGATDSGGSAGAVAPATSYTWLTSLFPTDPNTSAAWTLAALNAAQAGLKVET